MASTKETQEREEIQTALLGYLWLYFDTFPVGDLREILAQVESTEKKILIKLLGKKRFNRSPLSKQTLIGLKRNPTKEGASSGKGHQGNRRR